MSTLPPATGQKVDFNVRKPSASRPVGGRQADGFRTLRSGLRPPGAERVDLKWTWWRIRRQSMQRIERGPVTGHEVDGFRTLRSGLRPPGAERVDLKWTWWRIRRQSMQRIALSILYFYSLSPLSLSTYIYSLFSLYSISLPPSLPPSLPLSLSLFLSLIPSPLSPLASRFPSLTLPPRSRRRYKRVAVAARATPCSTAWSRAQLHGLRHGLVRRSAVACLHFAHPVGRP